MLLVWEYASIRWELHRHPERVEETLAGEEAAARAYEESVAGTRARRARETRSQEAEASRASHVRGVPQVPRSNEFSARRGSHSVNERRTPYESRMQSEERIPGEERVPSEARLRARQEREERKAREEARIRRVRRAYDGVRGSADRTSQAENQHMSRNRTESGDYTEIVASIDDDINEKRRQ